MINKAPFVLALLGMVGGVFIAILFGVNEEFFKSKIDEGLQTQPQFQALTDPQKKQDKIKEEATKNWRYYQRYHFHATGIGSMSMGVLLLLSLLTGPISLKRAASYCTAVGGFLYPFVWLFAAIYGPHLGRSVAKEKFVVFGYMGGVFLLGLILTLILLGLRQPKLEND